MELKEKIELTEKNIRQALKDYGKHLEDDCDYTDVLDDVSDKFIERLAKDSVIAKQGLREMLRKSPAWNEELDALVINGTRTHNPDYDKIYNLGYKILKPFFENEDSEGWFNFKQVLRFFSDPFAPEDEYQEYIDAIKEIAPKAYAPNKKPSRVFKALCDAVGVSDERAGSKFQHDFAIFADELSSRKINFKLYVSINPAHFLTMSNPKGDKRGETMTSCHTFNRTDYEYNCGCSGYARDSVTMIAFTVSDPSDPETLNNRKTTRQLYMYKPNNGLLLQSRMYNTSGGTHGAQEESNIYRDLIQREISECEGVPNLWKTKFYYGQNEVVLRRGSGFGGYCDWTFEDFAARYSIRSDHADDFEEFRIGTYGLCIECATEIDENLYCCECNGEGKRCACCEELYDNLYPVHTSDGVIYVCDSCRGENYYYCEECEEWFEEDMVTSVDGGDYVCDECLERYYSECAECDEWIHKDNMVSAIDKYGDEIKVCEYCRDNYYVKCDECGEYIKRDYVEYVDKDGVDIMICPSCLSNFKSEREDEAV